MFDRIAPRYDRLNRILSLRIDVAWRRRMARLLKDRGDLDLLDLATGTGDQLISLARHGLPLRRAVGLDMAERMLECGREKIRRAGLQDLLELRGGDATDIPFEAASFDAVTISFGIRNVVQVDRALREMRRVLRPGGRALILEFSLPGPVWIRGPYLFYLRHVMPRLGAWVSGDGGAYRYLNQTVETFPYGEAFCVLMRDAGFTGVQAHPQTLGIATIYQGDRPLESPDA